MNYIERRLIRWDLLRQKMKNRPSFTDGTTIRIELTMSTFPWEFSRSPIECDVSSLGIDDMLIYLLHTLGHYLRKRKSDPSDMAKFINLFDIIFIKVFKEPDITVKDEKRILLANLFIIMEEFCTKLLTPLNLTAKNDSLHMEKLSQNVRDIMNLIEQHSSDEISMKILRAATHNLINRFEERSELISQLKNWRYKNKIINEKHPEYSAANKVFEKAQENLFNRTYFAITVQSNGLASISKSKIDFRPSHDLMRLAKNNGPNIPFYSEDDVETLATDKITENMDKLVVYCTEYTTLEGNHANYYKILKSFSSEFWRRRLRVEQIMNSNSYFGRDELYIIFYCLWCFIGISDQLIYFREGDIVLIKKYMKIFYKICNSLSLSKILPLLDLYLVVMATNRIHDLCELPEAEPVRQEAVKLLMILSKLVYFLAPTVELKKCIQTFRYYPLDQIEYSQIWMMSMFRPQTSSQKLEEKSGDGI